MEPDFDLVLKQYIVNLSKSLAELTEQVNGRLTTLLDEVNRCNSNLTILEKKVGSTLQDHQS